MPARSTRRLSSSAFARTTAVSSCSRYLKTLDLERSHAGSTVSKPLWMA
ncbi:hypothetical protein ACP0HM_12860 [Escherichia coli]